MCIHVPYSSSEEPSTEVPFHPRIWHFQDAEIQHLASGTWALAKLHGTQQATGPTKDFLRSLAVPWQPLLEEVMQMCCRSKKG